jgi:hypothetical protein
MDPNATLQRIRELVEALTDHDMEDSDVVDAAGSLAESVGNLDGWISKGGFLPDAWLHVSGWVRS